MIFCIGYKKVPKLYRLLRLLVLGRHALERDNEVLQRPLLLVALGRLAVHEVVESDAVLQHVVNTTHDAEDTEREDPDTDNGNDVGLMTILEPTPNGEARGNDIDDKDSAGELPRGDGGPEGTVGTIGKG